MATFLRLRVGQSLMLMGQRVLLLVVDLPRTQLQQYKTSSRRNDPYVAGYGDHRDARVSLAELDAALSLLQKGATASRL
jgi:hypothetical protein